MWLSHGPLKKRRNERVVNILPYNVLPSVYNINSLGVEVKCNRSHTDLEKKTLKYKHTIHTIIRTKLYMVNM